MHKLNMNSFSQALLSATATDIQDIADILGVTFQEHCMATALKVIDTTKRILYFVLLKNHPAGVSRRGA